MARRTRRLFVLTGAAALLAAAAPARGLINPRFTPVHLVRQSGCIVTLRFAGKVAAGKAGAAVGSVLKGKPAGKKLTIDLTTTAYAKQAKLIEKLIASAGESPALMFFGKFGDGDGGESVEDFLPGEDADDGDQKAFLHLAGVWVVLYGQPGKAWGMDEISQQMIGTWAGGTDMLLRAVRYILADPAAEVPVAAGAKWGEARTFARIAGRVHGAEAIDLGDGKVLLHVAAGKGDRLFAFQAKGRTLKDVTAERKLRSRSRAAAWGDFNADGRTDLASWDGASLTVHHLSAGGAFQAGPSRAVPRCVGLAALGCGTGRAGVLVSTEAAPLLWRPAAGGKLAPLASAAAPDKALGPAGRCLVADFDGDGVADVLQPFAAGGRLYKAVKPGAFGKPAACPVALGQGRSAAALGDYDADGALDVFTVAEDGCRLWHNRGAGKFEEALKRSGEVAYISKTGGIAAATGDVNNDGRQDVLIVYAARPPQVFFNRGFRSFGFARQLDVRGQDVLDPAVEGQQAGCLADLDADGAQDLALVHADGRCWVAFRDPAGGCLALRAVLPAGGPSAGPVTATGWHGRRCLGAWNVAAGGPGAFVCLPDAGRCTLKWRWPGRKPQSRDFILEDQPVRFVLSPEDRKN